MNRRHVFTVLPFLRGVLSSVDLGSGIQGLSAVRASQVKTFDPRAALQGPLRDLSEVDGVRNKPVASAGPAMLVACPEIVGGQRHGHSATAPSGAWSPLFPVSAGITARGKV